MDMTEFLDQAKTLCLVNVVLVVILLATLIWIYYRRVNRQRAASPEPAKPGIGARVRGAIVNFFVEPSIEKEKEQKAATAPDWLQPTAETGPGAEPPAAETLETTVEPPPLEVLDGSSDEPEATSPPPEVGDVSPDASPPADTTFGPVVALTGPADTTPDASPPAVGDTLPAPTADATAQEPAPPPDAVEVLRVWRDLADGGLVIDFGDWRYRHVTELQDPNLRRRFVAVVRELNQMADAIGAPPAQPAAPAPGSQQRVQLAQQEGEPTEKRPGVLRQVGRVMMSRRLTPEIPPSEIEPPSIVNQIEEFLQTKLQNSEFSERSIHLRPSITGGVTVQVDDRAYEGVDDVEDPEVREFIQITIREWEARQ